MLLAHFLQKDRVFLHTNSDYEVGEAFFELVARRAQHEPLEYLTHQAGFYSRTFYVQEGVLIPRPETELLVELALKLIAKKGFAKICEIGVGSGAISVSLAAESKNVDIVGVDISQTALEVSRINAQKFGAEKRIRFCQSNILSSVEGDFDLIVSNPPYIQEGYAIPENLYYEPREALFGGKIGSEFIKRMLEECRGRYRAFLCEIGYDQKRDLTAYLRSEGYGKFRFFKDLAGHDRLLWMQAS